MEAYDSGRFRPDESDSSFSIVNAVLANSDKIADIDIRNMFHLKSNATFKGVHTKNNGQEKQNEGTQQTKNDDVMV